MENKISLAINKNQLECLVSFMERNEDLAKGVLKCANGRREANCLWEEITNVLNEKGPPVKKLHEWKKVWSDQKFKVKSKLRSNVKSGKKTGGGPYNKKKLNEHELSIAASAGLEASVRGIKAKSFGAPVTYAMNEDCEEYIPELPRNCNVLETQSINEREFDEEIFQSENTAPTTPRKTILSQSGRNKSGDSANKLGFMERYVKAIEDSNKIQNEILRVMNKDSEVKLKCYELEKKKYDLKKKRYDKIKDNDKEALKFKKLEIEVQIETNRLKRLELMNN